MIEPFINATLTHYPQTDAGHALDGVAQLGDGTDYECFFDLDGKAARALGNVGELEAADGYAIIETTAVVRVNDRAKVVPSNINRSDGQHETQHDLNGIVVGVAQIFAQLANVTIVSLKRCSQ